MKRLAIITTHPIQYNAPLFRLLAERGKLAVKIFYTWGQAQDAVYDPGFGKERRWDIPLLEGYDHRFLPNTAKDPGSHHFGGIVNPTILSELQAYQADAILVYGWSFRSHLQVMRYFKGKTKVFFRGDSTLLNDPPGFSFKTLLRRLALRWIYRYVDTALYVGTHNKQYYLASGLKPSQLRMAPHAVENARFAGTATKFEADAIQQRRNWGIPDEAVVLLFAGKLYDVKNVSLLISAFKHVNPGNAWLVIVGNGVEETMLKKMASNHPRIVFTDFQNQSEMPTVYRWGDVFVLPSKSETWGLGVNEAMACGRAVLVSNKCGCAPDLVKNGINGYVFASGNIYDLQEKLQLLLDKSTVQLMGRQSTAIISNYTFEHIALAIEQAVYENAIA